MFTVYSTGCPRCKLLKERLSQAGIEYNEVTDIEEIKSLGITSVPMMKMADEAELMSYGDSIRYVTNLVGGR